MKEEDLYKEIDHSDYLVRFDACQQLLDMHKIPREISEIRKVFPYIISKDLYKLGKKGINRLELAKKNLKTYIQEYHTEKDYSSFSKQELDDALLDECYYQTPNLQRIKKLVSLGADINAKDINSQTAFMYAVRHENFDIMEFFLGKGADINSAYPPPPSEAKGFYCTVWLNVLKYAKPDYIRLMMMHKANLQDKDSDGNNVLHIYCDGTPDFEIVKLFVDNSVEINTQNIEGNTPLHMLCQKRVKTECIAYLLENGAQINIQNDEEKTPLHYACWVYHTESDATEMLLEAGADPNIKDSEGNTPLFTAIYRENENLIKYLMDAGADLSIKNDKGKTAYEIALAKGYLEAAKEIAGDKAETDYKETPDYEELERIKKQIICDLKAGKYKCYSNKEGYARFFYKDGMYVYDWYEEGQEPPVTSTYATDEEALQFLYKHSSLKFIKDPDEIEVYRDILNMLLDK